MAKKIEILENTLLKLLVRRGDDADRQNITLSEGELGYTTDSKRLFIGDGSTLGGLITGNKFLGSVADHTTLVEGAEGDIAYNTTNNILYVKTSSGWDKIAQIFEAANDSIIVNDTLGTIAVGTLSSQHLSGANEITGNSIELVSGQISLSSTQIKTNRVTAYNTEYLTLPQKLNINSIDYTFPTGGLGGANAFLKAASDGSLSWSAPESNANLYFNSSAAAVPVGGMVESATLSSMPSGWLLANGQTVAGADYPDLSAAIGDIYGGNGTTFTLPDESSQGYVFIKALPDTIVTPTFFVQGGLSATVGGTQVAEGDSFSPLATNVVIQPIVPGVEVFEAAGADTFTTKSPYTKFWITGSGATGNYHLGGAAGTVTGILSAPIGTTVNLTVAEGLSTNNTHGNPSFISIGGTELARSFGGLYLDDNTMTNNWPLSSGNLSASNDYILGGHVITGAVAGVRTDGAATGGEASFWGGSKAPGAGGASRNGAFDFTTPGIIKFEWGM